jgi:xanthine dehydrogenase accessory factor
MISTMDSQFARKLADAVDSNTARCVATVISAEGSSPGKPGFKMLVYADGSIFGTVGGGEAEQRVIAAAMTNAEGVRTMRFELKGQPDAKDGSRMICGGAMEILLEPVGKTHQLYILGGGHCGIALSHLAKLSGFHVTVIDDRPEWAAKDKHPDADKIVLSAYSEAVKHITFSDQAYIVIMTHGHDADELLLRDFVVRQYKYLGLIASKRKVGLFFERMEKDGISKGRLARLYTPIGFDIGSETPAEIAVSIAAQLIAVRNGKSEIKFNANPLL